jgi:hypothetical protein
VRAQPEERLQAENGTGLLGAMTGLGVVMFALFPFFLPALAVASLLALPLLPLLLVVPLIAIPVLAIRAVLRRARRGRGRAAPQVRATTAYR